MEVKRIVNGRWEENCYIISYQEKAIVIDPGGNIEQMLDYLNNNSLTVSAVLNTHAHFDHIVCVKDLVEKYNCPFYLHSKDERLLKSANFYMNLFEGDEKVRIPSVNFYIDKIESPLVIGNFLIDVLHTPGHTDGSVCFIINQNLFSGDTLFKGKVGRIDLPGANKLKLKESLIKLSTLKEILIVYPGHGEETTIEEELVSNNYFLQMIS